MTSPPAALDLTAAAVRFWVEVAERILTIWARVSPPTRQFLRFVLVGGVTSVLYAAVFVVLEPTGYVGANAAGMILSTVVANEMHRRLTFRAASAKAWLPAHLEGGGLAVLALGATTLVLAAANAVVPGASWRLEVAIVLAATGIIGVAKFYLLRGLVFSHTH